MAEPSASNIIAGPVSIYLAATGTAFPSLATAPAAADWATAGFKAVGYTEAGAEITDTPTVLAVKPDEVIGVAKQFPTDLKTEIKLTLLEATLENWSRAVALASLSNPGSGTKTMSVGSGNPLQEFALGLQGTGPGGANDRVATIWRVNSLAAVTVNFARKKNSVIAVTFTALVDSTKSSGYDVYQVVDFNAGS